MSVIYTDAAKEELKNFHTRQQALLEEAVRERKVLLGDDILEITASDVRAGAKRIHVQPDVYFESYGYSGYWTSLVPKLYAFVGAAVMTGSLFYDEIMRAFENNIQKASFFAVGFAMLIAGLALSQYSRLRRERISRRLEYMSSTINSELQPEPRDLK